MLCGRLGMLGYKGESRADLINSVPVDVLTDMIYFMVTENMEQKEREEFDAELSWSEEDEARKLRERAEWAKLGGGK